jgi:hypothetical protein
MKEIVKEFSGLCFPKYTTIKQAVGKYAEVLPIPRGDGKLDGYRSEYTGAIVVRYRLGPRDILFWDYKPESSAKKHEDILFRKFS